jgi:hypothetical protein|tara:strand:+ start:8005 stop:8709 length:705 start_codon:yes stop_codon:yes gene_type:complete
VEALLDSDIIAYRIAFACKEESVKLAQYTIDKAVTDILLAVDHDSHFYDSWTLYLTGSNNFRHDVAVSYPYKGNRKAPKPDHLKPLRAHLIKEWNAYVCEGEEADDTIGIACTDKLDKCIIVTLDKDLDQLQGWHYNFHRKTHYYTTLQQAERFFYKQLLTGDTTDNIIGLKGIGPVKAEKILGTENISEKEMYDKCLEAYDGDEVRVLENARLLWLRRTPNQMWLPPTGDIDE